jgi:hypothetical protein
VNCGPRSYFHHIAITCLLSRTVYFTRILLLFSTRYTHNLCFKQTGEIDNLIASWEQSTWLCVCRFHVAASTQSLDEAPYINCPLLSQTSKHHLQSSLSLLSKNDKPWFLNWGKTSCYIHHTFLVGFPTGWSITTHKETSGAINHTPAASHADHHRHQWPWALRGSTHVQVFFRDIRRTVAECPLTCEREKIQLTFPSHSKSLGRHGFYGTRITVALVVNPRFNFSCKWNLHHHNLTMVPPASHPRLSPLVDNY